MIIFRETSRVNWCKLTLTPGSLSFCTRVTYKMTIISFSIKKTVFVTSLWRGKWTLEFFLLIIFRHTKLCVSSSDLFCSKIAIAIRKLANFFQKKKGNTVLSYCVSIIPLSIFRYFRRPGHLWSSELLRCSFRRNSLLRRSRWCRSTCCIIFLIYDFLVFFFNFLFDSTNTHQNAQRRLTGRTPRSWDVNKDGHSGSTSKGQSPWGKRKGNNSTEQTKPTRQSTLFPFVFKIADFLIIIGLVY